MLEIRSGPSYGQSIDALLRVIDLIADATPRRERARRKRNELRNTRTLTVRRV
jgi:hypothetical protein